MKILIANLGSTSLKWRLFDFSNGEKLLHKGGFERVEDYPKVIGDCLTQIKDAQQQLLSMGEKRVAAGSLNLRLSRRCGPKPLANINAENKAVNGRFVSNFGCPHGQRPVSARYDHGSSSSGSSTSLEQPL